MNTGGRVVVVGTLNVDQIWQVPTLPRTGETVIASAVERQFGGKGANQAVAAARQGATVTLVGAVGDDADGARYREHLQREGIDAAFLATAADRPTGAAHVYVDPRGENLIVVDRGANERLDPESLSRVLPQADVLLVQLECALDAAVEALWLAAVHGVRSILNASPVNSAFPWGRHAIDAVIVNEHECHAGFGLTPETFLRVPAAERAACLLARKVRNLIVTRGAESTLHFAENAIHEVPTHPVVPRDTVGAGDTFAGALAAERARGQAWEPALRYANIAAALSTLAVGAQTAMPRRADVECSGRGNETLSR